MNNQPPKIHLQKLIEAVSVATQDHLNQTTKTPIKQPNTPQKFLGNPSIINLIHQTCVELACKEVMEINDVVHRQDMRPLMEIKSEPIMVGKWLFDTGAGIPCMSYQQFRLIPIENRPTKFKLNQ